MRAKDPNNKALVFSQFTAFLDLVEYRLKMENISCAKITGAVNIKTRNNIVLDFNLNKEVTVLMLSLKAAGEGLNLQAANYVFVLDPWWNPAAELQAIQRAHRIGQDREVTAVRFCMKNTIEEKILALQEKKQQVFDVTVGAASQLCRN